MDPIENMCQALKSDHLILHPTDTIPGLGCLSTSEKGVLRINKFKNRPESKSGYVSLVDSLDSALKFFTKLPPDAEEKLREIWPGPFTVVAPCSRPSLQACSPDGHLALRVPNLNHRNDWMIRLLSKLEVPLISTSVNISGMPPLHDWDDARDFLEAQVPPDIILPENGFMSPLGDPAPSTMIQWVDSEFRLLRRGGLKSYTQIKGWVK